MKNYIKLAICFLLGILVMKLLSPFFAIIGWGLGIVICTALIYFAWSYFKDDLNLPF